MTITISRYNKIFQGPYTEALPHAGEGISAAALLPGQAVSWSAGALVVAGLASNEHIMIVQDNYLAAKTVSDAWTIGDTVIVLGMLDTQAFAVLVPTGNSITKGLPLTTNASGKFIPAGTGQRIIAIAGETYNNTSGVDQLVKVRAAKSHLAHA